MKYNTYDTKLIFMKKILSFLFILFSNFSFGQSAQEFKILTIAQTGFSEERLKKLDNYLQSIINDGIAPNAVSIVVHKGNIVHFKAFGFSNLENKTPLKRDDIFRIASQSKAITTVGLMILFEEGKFSLDDPISKYIPEFENPQVFISYDSVSHKVNTRPAKSEITIRQLLSHNAGIPYDHPLQELPEYKVPFLFSLQNETLAQVIPKLAKRPLMFDPGEKFTYGLNTDILGYLIEKLSGKNLDVFLHEKIIDPLGMKDTYFYLPDKKAPRLVEVYSKAKPEDKLTVHQNELFRKFPISGAKTYFSGGAGLVSTAEDYAKFIQMILNGGWFNKKNILSRKTIDLMSRNQIGEATVWERQDKFGLGFQIITEKSHYGDNASVNSLTWGGLFCSEYTIDPKEELIMMVLTNVHPYCFYSDFVHKYRTLVYQALK